MNDATYQCYKNTKGKLRARSRAAGEMLWVNGDRSTGGVGGVGAGEPYVSICFRQLYVRIQGVDELELIRQEIARALKAARSAS